MGDKAHREQYLWQLMLRLTQKSLSLEMKIGIFTTHNNLKINKDLGKLDFCVNCQGSQHSDIISLSLVNRSYPDRTMIS